jgi:hypothetical protein
MWGCDGHGGKYDVCGVCNGDGSSCTGCDGIPFSNKTKDKCGVCGGNSTPFLALQSLTLFTDACVGCDGVPNSGAKVDICGKCNGNNECVPE